MLQNIFLRLWLVFVHIIVCQDCEHQYTANAVAYYCLKEACFVNLSLSLKAESDSTPASNHLPTLSLPIEVFEFEYNSPWPCPVWKAFGRNT